MKIRLTAVSGICALILAVASCSFPVVNPAPASAIPTTPDIKTTPELSSTPAPAALVSVSPPSDTQSLSATPAPTWQICTWILYQLDVDPSAPKAGQTVKIWAYIYIEDFPITDVLTDLLVNGVVVAHQVVTVNFDETWPFYFNFTPDNPGIFDISIRAILADNAAFATLPGGGSDYNEVSGKMVVQS